MTKTKKTGIIRALNTNEIFESQPLPHCKAFALELAAYLKLYDGTMDTKKSITL